MGIKQGENQVSWVSSRELSRANGHQAGLIGTKQAETVQACLANAPPAEMCCPIQATAFFHTKSL
eukprot:scaffold159113_cov15-Tisochrysis_lutea.AAC.3